MFCCPTIGDEEFDCDEVVVWDFIAAVIAANSAGNATLRFAVLELAIRTIFGWFELIFDQSLALVNKVVGAS